MVDEWGRGRPKTEEKVIDGIEHKFCNHCQSFKPLTDFRYRAERGQYVTPCKPCWNQVHKRWRDENHAHFREYQRQWRAKRKEQT